MRRHDKVITDKNMISNIIKNCQVARLGLCDNNIPYIVPLCFGYDGESFYFHCATEGKKTDILKKNNNVCIELDIAEGVIENQQACSWTMKYKSVIAFGRSFLIQDINEKKQAFDFIMKQYSNRSFEIPEDRLIKTAVFKIIVDELTAKGTK